MLSIHPDLNIITSRVIDEFANKKKKLKFIILFIINEIRSFNKKIKK
jgi:hypothetical protein